MKKKDLEIVFLKKGEQVESVAQTTSGNSNKDILAGRKEERNQQRMF